MNQYLILVALKEEISLPCFRKDKSIVTTINGCKIHHWIHCTSLKQVCEVSPYWTMKKLKGLFDCTDEEMILVGGGTFTIKQGYSYLVHSVNTMGVYVSQYKQWENLSKPGKTYQNL